MPGGEVLMIRSLLTHLYVSLHVSHYLSVFPSVCVSD